MELELRINGVIKSLDVAPNELLLNVLRREGYFSVKHGCDHGHCGACTVLIDGLPRPSCIMLAMQAAGATLTTVEGLGSFRRLHPLQEAFIDAGVVHCGFCAPGMLLSAYALLQRNSNPSEEEIREALAGNLCRCSGYNRIVQAVQRAAALLRGEDIEPLSIPDSGARTRPWDLGRALPEPSEQRQTAEQAGGGVQRIHVMMGRPERQIDAIKLVTGKPAFADDCTLPGLLHARLLTSPHAHAIIREIDTTEARALPGVHAVLTYKDIPRIPYTSAGQSWPEPEPHDQYSLDYIVRYVGDRVAVVAAESAEIAEQALKLIKVDYEPLPAVFDPRQALEPGAPRLHPEPESYRIYDADRNIAARVQYEQGNVERAFASAELIVEGEYIVPQIQHTALENHVAITYWDEDERLVVRTSSEVPYHVRRILASLTGLAPRRIRVIAPRVGGGFGAKHDLIVEDLCALLTLATDRPVRLEYSRADEFRSSRVVPSQIIRLKTGLRQDGTIIANQMLALINTGAYGSHANTLALGTGLNSLALYPCPNVRYSAQAVYTNLPPAGTFRSKGATAGLFALESHMDEIARRLGMDPLVLRRKNWLKEGDANPAFVLTGAGYQSSPGSAPASTAERRLKHCGLPYCLQVVEEQLNWREKRRSGRGSSRQGGRIQRGVGLALAVHLPDPRQPSLSSATLKLNEDGSFNLLLSLPENGTGSHTILAQIAADVLGVRPEDILVHAPDTDCTPFETSSDPSSSLYACVHAVRQAAEQVRHQLLATAARLLKVPAENLTLADYTITAPNGQSLSLSQTALQALYGEQPRQISATTSWNEACTTPTFAAQGVEVEVDTETGGIHVLKVVTAVDGGHIVNPVIAEGQIEGGIAQGLSYSLCEEMVYDQQGNVLTTNLSDYRILSTRDMPETSIVLMEGDGADPLDIRDIGEIAIAAIAPALANAVADATGVRLRQLPLTPERVLRALYLARQQATGRPS
ncbi:molybdopterin-dependent oxidoreductase [Thermogemmatispora sp.]|uniref:molybdopterin-dependent oxidoreductase n=1 Tax=Thermogemmatispora sp. TaxID=1968838 RepID=UPI001D3AC579|nr:molybdopterin cofactor-binding domain-containing protein [Thermogemmatispora sp.]MBX5448684.1 molybdopterin-dependent oxidoreductase [Thermogemmatispora sp.]